MAKVETLHLSPSAQKLRETEAAVKEYDFIRFTTADMNGLPRGVLVPTDLAAKSLKSGIGCFAGKLS